MCIFWLYVIGAVTTLWITPAAYAFFEVPLESVEDYLLKPLILAAFWPIAAALMFWWMAEALLDITKTHRKK